jgi:hypothetical protein
LEKGVGLLKIAHAGILFSLHAARRLSASLSQGKWEGLLKRKIEASQDAFGVGQVAEDSSDRRGLRSKKGRHGQDLLLRSDLWILRKIDDLDLIASGEMFCADPLEIADGSD